MAQIKRETASICRVYDILQGTFVKAEGWNPSYFITSLGNLSRVNILGVIVARESNGVVLDDGSGRIVLRSFEEGSLNSVEIGDFVTVIGRPRMYGEQRYIMPEIIKKTSPDWAEYRRKQISFLEASLPKKKQEKRIVVNEPVQPTANQFHKIVEFIRDLDAGEGADAEEVGKRAGFPNSGELIRKLIEEGEIFEVRPGRLKILE